jgi:RimJ/RimL family protein N-acetyltransferase
VTSSLNDVRLRDVVESDFPIFFEHQRDSDATRMAAFPARDWEAFQAHWTTKILGDPAVAKKTILFGGQVAGNVVSFERAGTPLVGYWIGKEFWGKGIATSALSLFLETVRTRPLFAHVAKQNAGSIRVLEKCGFRLAAEQPPGPGDDGVEEIVMELGDLYER